MSRKSPQQSQLYEIRTGTVQEALGILSEYQAQARRPRRFLREERFLLVKEIPSPLHARIAMYVQDALQNAFVECLPLQQNGSRERWRVEGCGDGCK
jgi:hypothetical protein